MPEIKRLTPATVDDLFWEFARAEVRNDARHDRMYSRGLGAELVSKVRSGQRGVLSRSERARVRATVLSTRPGYLRPLLRLGLRWSYGELPSGELLQLRVPDLDIFRSTAPSQLLQDYAAALDRGGPHLWPPLAKNFRAIRPRFDPRRMVGVPIVIGSSPRGPFTIVEGTTRLSVLVSRLGRGQSRPPKIRLLFGLGPRAPHWWCF